MKKLLVLVLALVMVMSAFAITAVAEEDVVEATAIVFTSPGFTPKKDTYGVEYIKENYGLYLDILPVDTATEESWSTFWAADGYSDIIVPYNGSQGPALVDEDLCRTISFDTMKENMPRLYSMMQMVWGDDASILAALNYKGEVWCIPYFGNLSHVSFISCIRNDWLEKVNLTVPTTIDELTEVLRAFTFDDPDGNGIDDTYGVTCETYGMYNVAGSYGTTNCLAYEKSADGTAVTCNATTEEYRNYLRKLNEWFEAGYIDPEFVTNNTDRATVRSKWASGLMGILCDHPWWYELERGEVGPLQMLMATDESVTWDTFSYFGKLATDDSEGAILRGYVDPRGQASVYFGYDASDEVVLKMMQLIDSEVVLYDDTEEDYVAIKIHADLATGIEGTDWEWNEDHTRVNVLEGGTAGYLGNYASDMGFYIFPSANCTDLARFEGRVDESCLQIYDMAIDESYVWRTNNFPKPALTGELADKGDLVGSYFTEAHNAFITGDMDIEADWDAYVAEINAKGLEDILAFYTAEVCG